jgi:uncharacterized protein
VFMLSGEIYEISIGPLGTSNAFEPGHQIRLEVSSSNFPHYSRNLNTGGDAWSETKAIVAHNTVHHTRKFPSQIILPVVPE